MNDLKDENKFQEAKLIDKIRMCLSKNKIQYTDFLDELQQKEALKVLNKQNFKNLIWFGGNDNSIRKMLIFYPDKINENIVYKNIEDIVCVIRINLPADLINTYEHRDYLSGIMKLGIKREKFR